MVIALISECTCVFGCVDMYFFFPTDDHINFVEESLLQKRELLDPPKRRYRRGASE